MTPNDRSTQIASKVMAKQQTIDSKHEEGETGGGGIGGSALFDKTKCCDIFNDVVVDDLNMYEQRSDRVKLQMKFKRMTYSHELTKVKFMLGVGGLMDIFYLKSVIKKIQLKKQLFVLELEQGQEVFIPNELSVESYPPTFTYYDPVIQIINHLFT